MREYVEKMIKDKFLLDIIGTAFYEYGKPVEVLHPDLNCVCDLILSCNGKDQFIRIKYQNELNVIGVDFAEKNKSPSNGWWFVTQDNHSKDNDNLLSDLVENESIIFGFDLPMLKSFGKDAINICTIILTIKIETLNISKYQVNDEVKDFDNMLKDLFDLNEKLSLNCPRSKEHLFQKSTLMEQFGTYAFIRDIRETAWIEFKRQIFVLRGEVDAFGYDILLMCNEKKRYIQLKSTKTPKRSRIQPVNINLAEKEGGGVVWQTRDEKKMVWKEMWKCGYYFLGNKPNSCLTFLHTCASYKHKKKPKLSKRKVKFSFLCDLSYSCYLDTKSQIYKKTNLPFFPYDPMINLINILFDIYPTGTT